MQKLNSDYKTLQNEVAEVDKIRVNVYKILRKGQQKEQPKKSKSRGIEL
jgi:hypothetical protein